MELSILIKGILMGFSIAAPVGPIGVLCIRRTIANGRLSGFVSGLGAASADGLYGGIAAFGLTFISGFLVSQQIWLRIVGGLFLIYLGVRTMIAQPANEAASAKDGGIIGDFVSTFFLTVTNPMTILSFAAVFAGLGLVSAGNDYSTAGTLVGGVVLGSAGWWLCLSSLVSVFRKKFNRASMLLVNRISGLIILTFGVWAVVGLLFITG